MATNIESRIEALEAKLVLSNPEERLVIFNIWVGRDSTPDQITAYSDGGYSDENERVLQRQPDESPELFEARAEAWARFEHRHDDPAFACVLSGSARRVTAALCE